jgi:hypothetical protein
MNTIELVVVGLQTGGYDGLVVPGNCGCLIGELSPGDCLSNQCEAAYKHTHSQRPQDWITSTKKDGITDDDIEQCIRECC